MVRALLIASLALATLGSAEAQPPPPPDGSMGPPDRPGMRDRGDRQRAGSSDRDRRRGPATVAVDSERWTKAQVFLTENSPHRMAMYERFVERMDALGDERPQMQEQVLGRLRGRIVRRVEELGRLQESNPDEHAHALQQFRSEDAILGHLMDAREAREAGDSDGVKNAVAAARKEAERFLGLALDRRARQLDEASERLDRERARLERDRERVNELSQSILGRFERMVDRDDPEGGPPTTPSPRRDRGPRPSTRPVS
ncbi:MAG: hypothetical protein AAGI46_06800 [Planctomycetota bacterium]